MKDPPQAPFLKIPFLGWSPRAGAPSEQNRPFDLVIEIGPARDEITEI